MTDAVFNPATANAADRRDIGIKSRRAAEKRFRAYGLTAITLGLLFLVILLVSIVSKGYTAFFQTEITLPIEFSEKVIDPTNKRKENPKVLIAANYPKLATDALVKAAGIDPTDKMAVGKLRGFISDSVRAQLRAIVEANPDIVGKTVPVTMLAAANIDSAYKGQIDITVPEKDRKVSDAQVQVMKKLAETGALATHFNPALFTNGAPPRPDQGTSSAKPAGSGRPRRGDHRFGLHHADRALAGAADRRLRLDLP